MSTIEDAKNQLGELFIIGFNGFELSDDTSAFISQAKIGGVILFAANYDNPAQVTELIRQVQEGRSGLPLWIAVDHEGGKVQRFRKGFTQIPSAETIGKANSPKLTFQISEIMATELRAVGVNLNFCPVADIWTNPKNAVLNTRTYGQTEDQVSKMVTAMVRGHVIQKVQPCIKHFPGHGDTFVDSHFVLPKVNTPIDVLQNRELKPFYKALRSHCSCVMTAHILNPTIDPDFPATLSKKTIQNLLKQQNRASPIIISDDLEMKAITDNYGLADAPRLALEAGCDILIYKTEATARKAYDALLKSLEDNKLDPGIVLEAAKHVRTFKQSALMPYEPPAMTELSTKIGIEEYKKIIEQLESEVRKQMAKI
ncbi:MAG: beta-N-acetylhexosaminidase [Deltaproteobacteria bacterium]|nr:beta-N-acetylhexosaminidase [Deltaproteobacteria bacterium]